MRARCLRARVALGAALVAGVGLVAFGRARSFGFIYDDYWTVVGNTQLDKPLRELVLAAASGRAVEWGMPDATRPMMGWSLWLDRRLFGLAPGGYHSHSLALYALCSVLVFLLAIGVLRRFGPALAAGLLFAALPIHVEVAAVVNYREDLIAAVGLLGAAAIVFWPLRLDPRWRVLGAGLLWAYALLGKESALVAPAFIAALAIVRRPRLGNAGAALPPSLVYGSVAALWLNWRFGLSRLGEQIPTASYASWTERALRTARFESLAVYQSLWPFGPRPERDPLGPAHAGWLLALGAIVAAIVWLARRRRTRVLAAAVAIALVAPLCTSPLLAPRNEIADRYWFVGSLAACLVVAWVLSLAPLRRSGWLALALLVGGCTVASRKASTVWASEVDLWTFIAQTAPASPRSWSGLARVHRLAEQEDLAERALDRALTLEPDHLPSQAASVLGSLWFGKLDAARAQLRAMGDRDGLHGDALRIVRRCAASPSAEAAQLCVRRTVPAGMILGDPARLRAVSERLLGQPPPRAMRSAPRRPTMLDAGIDAGAHAGSQPGAGDVDQ
jgi:protein O-mannosyl-transferase